MRQRLFYSWWLCLPFAFALGWLANQWVFQAAPNGPSPTGKSALAPVTPAQRDHSPAPSTNLVASPVSVAAALEAKQWVRAKFLAERWAEQFTTAAAALQEITTRSKTSEWTSDSNPLLAAAYARALRLDQVAALAAFHASPVREQLIVGAVEVDPLLAIALLREAAAQDGESGRSLWRPFSAAVVSTMGFAAWEWAQHYHDEFPDLERPLSAALARRFPSQHLLSIGQTPDERPDWQQAAEENPSAILPLARGDEFAVAQLLRADLTDSRTLPALIDSLPEGRNRAAQEFFDAWDDLDPERFITHHLSWLSQHKVNASYGLLYDVGDANLPLLQSMLTTFKGSENRAMCRAVIVENLADKSPQQALDWALTLEDPEDVGQAVNKTFYEWADGDASAALAAASKLTDPAVRATALQAAVANLPREELLSVLPAIPMADRKNILTEAWASLGQDAPELYAQELANYIQATQDPVPVLSEHSARDLFQDWRILDPQAPLAWPLALPEGAQRETAIRGFYSQADPADAALFLTTQPPSPAKDLAVAVMLDAMSDDLLAEKLAWARTLQTPALRAKHLPALESRARRLGR